MRKAQFDNLRPGDKIRKRLSLEVWTVVLNDAGSIIAVRGEKTYKATRLINSSNWGFTNNPGHHMTDDEFYKLTIGSHVRYPYGPGRETFTVVLNDGDWIVAVEDTKAIEVARFRNPGNVIAS